MANCKGSPPQQVADTTLHIPLGGNTWAAGVVGDDSKWISNTGITNWTDSTLTFNTWLRVNKTGTLQLKLNASAANNSRLRVTIGNTSKEIAVPQGSVQWLAVGEFAITDTGYVNIKLAGISKEGARFPNIREYEITGTVVNEKTAYVKSNEGNYFYWGRRGPSVHLNFSYPDSVKAQWYYNEVTVPVGQDVIGSYFMATGFGEGYFGIQVNSDKERRILFSVWSPYNTDNPGAIPPDMRIELLKKGKDVHTGEFGNEGSGGQSYLIHHWKAGITYKFLLGGTPDGNGATTYTAWFFDPEQGKWMLVASFKRPKTNTYLKRFHSFLENFIPEQGNKERRVEFGNQWIVDSKGTWIEVNKAVFTYDNTAAMGYRMDYAGGMAGKSFYLKNAGFFNQYTAYRSVFTRPLQNKKPKIDFTALP